MFQMTLLITRILSFLVLIFLYFCCLAVSLCYCFFFFIFFHESITQCCCNLAKSLMLHFFRKWRFFITPWSPKCFLCFCIHYHVWLSHVYKRIGLAKTLLKMHKYVDKKCMSQWKTALRFFVRRKDKKYIDISIHFWWEKRLM